MIHQKIREARTKAGLSQSELAELVGTSRTALSAIENDQRNISFDLARRIFSAMGLEMEIVLRKVSPLG